MQIPNTSLMKEVKTPKNLENQNKKKSYNNFWRIPLSLPALFYFFLFVLFFFLSLQNAGICPTDFRWIDSGICMSWWLLQRRGFPLLQSSVQLLREDLSKVISSLWKWKQGNSRTLQGPETRVRKFSFNWKERFHSKRKGNWGKQQIFQSEQEWLTKYIWKRESHAK